MGYIVLQKLLHFQYNYELVFPSYHINVVTITQSAPSDGAASVSLDLRVSEMTESMEPLLKDINSQSFVISAKEVIK